jgi:hypothetical protein
MPVRLWPSFFRSVTLMFFCEFYRMGVKMVAYELKPQSKLPFLCGTFRCGGYMTEVLRKMEKAERAVTLNFRRQLRRPIGRRVHYCHA